MWYNTHNLLSRNEHFYIYFNTASQLLIPLHIYTHTVAFSQFIKHQSKTTTAYFKPNHMRQMLSLSVFCFKTSVIVIDRKDFFF